MKPLTFLSDYGHTDEFVGVVHGVIARINPGAPVIDLTHGIERHDVRAGALALAVALPYCPAGVHLAVVDPEVGAGGRRAVALRTAEDQRLLVGPDNGLLMLAAERFGGVVEAVEISASPHRLQPVSATFHGRDIFAPVAARLAGGAPLQAAGEPLAADELVQLALPQARIAGHELLAHVLVIDRFGNVGLNATHEQLGEANLRLGAVVRLEIEGTRERARFVRTFADVDAGELLLYEDADRRLSVAVNRGSAVQRLRVKRDDELRLSPWTR
ncbi:MAG: SAM-dependent chlorinase/fluorinase [Solirubrobacteraceae bacterium]